MSLPMIDCPQHPQSLLHSASLFQVCETQVDGVPPVYLRRTFWKPTSENYTHGYERVPRKAVDRTDGFGSLFTTAEMAVEWYVKGLEYSCEKAESRLKNLRERLRLAREFAAEWNTSG